MKVIILANGNGTRWNNYKGVEKQLIKIDGETLLHRMCRLCHENGIDKNDLIIIGKFEDEYAINDEFDNCDLKRQLFLRIAKRYREPFILLNGDCHYTDAIIKDCINRNVDKWGHWCRLSSNPFTGKEWGEGYIHKVIAIDWWINKLEEFGDRKYEKFMKTLYREEVNPIEIIKWTSIYKCFENTFDDCEKLGDFVDDVVMKNL